MMRALWTAATGMIAQQTNIDSISNNLSNVNTTGYKAENAEFKSLLYQNIQTITTSANGVQKPIPAQVGLGTRVASITSDFTNGPLLANSSNTAFALEGKGFFAVLDENGETCYTRNGKFGWSIGVDGVTLCDQSGLRVLDTAGNPIVEPNDVNVNSLVVSNDGHFYYKDADENTIDMGVDIGVFQFTNPQGLEKDSRSLLRVTEASGPALNEATNPGLIRSRICQNYLEGSNVNVADEMVNMIVAQRAYELNSKAIQAADEMLGQANQLRR
ncbi:MAG: flagellar hook-basal body protein [Lachnospiraceae bacterium]|nr:flagellar hook-basal body protein [Lachnospiraceae bacterium]